MRSVIVTAFILALATFAAAGAAFAGTNIRTVTDTNGHVSVELSGDAGNNATYFTFFVAIAPTGSYTVSYQVPAGDRTTRGAAADTVTVSTPFTTRGTRMLWIRAAVPPDIKLSYVNIDYAPATDVRDAATADPLVR